MPFDFTIVHTPGRSLGMADYLSRQPSEYEGSVAKAEDIFNDRFETKVINMVTPELNRLAKTNQPI